MIPTFWMQPCIISTKDKISNKKQQFLKNGKKIKRVSLTGCWGASLRILKTCATFPLARRCILKLGMAHRVAKLIILEQWERERKDYRNVQSNIYQSCAKTMNNERKCGTVNFQISVTICHIHLRHDVLNFYSIFHPRHFASVKTGKTTEEVKAGRTPCSSR